MGRIHESIDARLQAFVQAQHVFFVSTAPSDDQGHINLSPKGLDSLRILDPHTVAYLDYIGSGVETIAHLQQNARICVMFCAFDGPPNIVRFHGHGEVVEPQDGRFGDLRAIFPADPGLGVRAIIVVYVTRISDSCGYGVPLMRYEGDRTQLSAWAERKGADGLQQYQRDKNAKSIDGAPGLRWAAES